MSAIRDFVEFNFYTMRKVRVIKKDSKFYPQYLRVSFLFRTRRWCFFEYSESDVICSGYVHEWICTRSFNTKQEARDFLRKEGYKL